MVRVRIEVYYSPCAYPLVPAPLVDKAILSLLSSLLQMNWSVYEGLFLDSLFCFTNLYAYPSASITQSCLLKLFSKPWTISSPTVPLFKIVLAILGPSYFHICFSINLSNLQKSLLEFWLGLHWIYKSIYRRLTF